MIAKVTNSGSGVAGLVQYIYDGREEHRQRGDKKAEVIIHSENLQMPRDADDLAGRRALVRDFDNRAKQRTEQFDFVGMHVLSFTKEDIKRLNKLEIKDLCTEYAAMAGLKNTQYFAIAHNDTDHYHVHFVFNRIDNRGVKLDTHYEKLKTTFRGVALSLNYGLKLKGESFKIGQSYKMAEMRHKHNSVLELIKNDQTDLLKTSKNLNDLKYLADKKGIKVIEYWSQQKDLQKNGLKIGEISKENLVSFNMTKIGDKEYRNEDLRAIFYGNTAKEKVHIIDNKQDRKELYKWNFEMEIPNVNYSKEKGQTNYRYIMDFGPIKNSNKNATKKQPKIAEHEIKIQKLDKQHGIKV